MLWNAVEAKIVGAESPWKRMWLPKSGDTPKLKVKLPPLKGKWFDLFSLLL
jgi:hypothetical protein